MEDRRGTEIPPQRTHSFLVRVWYEPREEGKPTVPRTYVRNLQTGEQHYLAELGELERYLFGELGGDRSVSLGTAG